MKLQKYVCCYQIDEEFLSPSYIKSLDFIDSKGILITLEINRLLFMSIFEYEW